MRILSPIGSAQGLLALSSDVSEAREIEVAVSCLSEETAKGLVREKLCLP